MSREPRKAERDEKKNIGIYSKNKSNAILFPFSRLFFFLVKKYEDERLRLSGLIYSNKFDWTIISKLFDSILRRFSFRVRLHTSTTLLPAYIRSPTITLSQAMPSTEKIVRSIPTRSMCGIFRSRARLRTVVPTSDGDDNSTCNNKILTPHESSTYDCTVTVRSTYRMYVHEYERHHYLHLTYTSTYALLHVVLVINQRAKRVPQKVEISANFVLMFRIVERKNASSRSHL